MGEAFEVSADDATGVAEAIQRAARGDVVHIVRNGQPLADIVPAGQPTVRSATEARETSVADDSELTVDEQAIREARASERQTADVEASRVHAERFGAPTLEHYRAVYAQAGAAWPGESFVRRHYPVGDTS